MTSTQPFKFRHLDTIIGAFVLGSVAIVILAVAFIGSARQWFTPATEVLAASPPAPPAEREFLEDLAESLKPGLPVEMGGRAVGAVLGAEVRDGGLRLRLRIANRALAQLHRGIVGPEGRSGEARVVIKAPLAPFMGQPAVVLKPGSAGPQGWLEDDWHRHQPLPLAPPKDTAAIAKQVLLTVDRRLDPLLAAATDLLTETRQMVAELRAARLPEQAGAVLGELRERALLARLDALLQRAEAVAGQVQAIAAETERLARGLNEGRGLAGRVIADERLAADLSAIVAELKAISVELRRAAPAAPGLAQGAESLLADVQRLVDGLERHWLLRPFVSAPAEGRLDPPGIVAPPEGRP